jgi:hypothetical protein
VVTFFAILFSVKLGYYFFYFPPHQPCEGGKVFFLRIFSVAKQSTNSTLRCELRSLADFQARDRLEAFLIRLDKGHHPNFSEIMQAANDISDIFHGDTPCFDCKGGKLF